MTWTVPAIDAAHHGASGFNLRFGPSGADSWMVVSGVTSPHTLSGLAAGAAIDVQLQSVNAAGTSTWSPTSTLATAGAYVPNAPAITSVVPPPDGTTTHLAVTWTAPTTDSGHSAATGYNLRSSPAGAGTWTTVAGVKSPHILTDLAGATAMDVEVQATNAAASASPWSSTATGTTWGTAILPGDWGITASQIRHTSTMPNGGANMTATPAPTPVVGAAFAWSSSQSEIPTSGLIAANTDGQPDGWRQWFYTPPTAGVFYLWMLGLGADGATTGAFVSSAITVR